MKLITKIFLAFGFILVAFIFVTVSYVEQTDNVEADVEQALKAAEIMRLAASMEKSIIDSETGLRGFLVSDNESFLVPFFNGRQSYQQFHSSLLQLVRNRQQFNHLQKIDSTYSVWLNTFAEPSIRLQKAALRSPEQISAFEEFKTTKIRTGTGKNMMDDIRKEFIAFKAAEQVNRNRSAASLKKSIGFTNQLATSLTVLCVIIGFVVVFILTNAIRERLKEITKMANEVAAGHFKVHLKDNRNDEITQVSKSLNIMASKLDDSFEALQKKNRELDQFAYVVSHDLKAPLRAINSLAEWIEEDLPDVDPDVQRNLQLMRSRVLRMENLINAILDYSKIGRKEIPVATFSTAQLLTEIIDSLAPEGDITWRISPELPDITTERVMLHQVFANLIGNAIKYNDKPMPIVTVGCKALSTGYEFNVKDNGPGIPEEYHQKVFGVFQTMEARDTRESTGIGLAIVKKILDEKGGTVQIVSEAGTGSNFIFFWPLQVEAASAQSELLTA